MSGEDLFTSEEIAVLLARAFAGAKAPATGEIEPRRLAHLRGYSSCLLSKIESVDVATGHLTWSEVVTLLTGAALAAQMLHGGDA